MIYQKLSNKNFTNQDISDMDLSDYVEGMTIENSTFYHEDDATKNISLKDLFGAKLKNVTFINCNLDNIKIPGSATLINCSNRTIIKQVDDEDWVCDKTTKQPVEPVNVKAFLLSGKNTDPSKIKPKG